MRAEWGEESKLSSCVGRQLLPGSACSGRQQWDVNIILPQTCHYQSPASLPCSTHNIAGSNLSALWLSVSYVSSYLIRCVQSKLIMTFELQDKEHEMKQQIELCLLHDDAGLMTPFMNRNTFITAQFSTLVAAQAALLNKTHLMLLNVLNSICCQWESYQWHKNDGCSILIPLKTASYSCLCSSFSELKAAT